MAVITCSECGGMVSTMADACPHCGCPMSKIESTICVIKGVPYDLREVLEIAREGDTPRARGRGCRKITVITGLDVDNGGIWKQIVETGKIPKTYITLAERRAAEADNVPKCPTCGSTDLLKKTAAGRALDGFVFGRLSAEGRSQFQCRTCGYMW